MKETINVTIVKGLIADYALNVADLNKVDHESLARILIEIAGQVTK